MSDVLLAELKDADATGRIAEIYQDLRYSLRVPMVNLIFRHLATIPGCLEWVWDCVGPVYATGAFSDGAAALCTTFDIPRLTLPHLIGLDEHARNTVIRTCDAYARANPANLLALRVIELILDDASPAQPPPRLARSFQRPAAIALEPLPPLGDLTQLPQHVTTLLHQLASQVHGEDGPVIPSFYRHFTAWPLFLETLHTHLAAIMPALNNSVGGFESAARLQARALFEKQALQGQAKPSTAGITALRAVIARFPPNLCKMTLLPQAVKAALLTNQS